MEEHLEHIKKIKKMLGEFLGDIAEEKKINGSNVSVVKETLSAYQKACWLCEDLEEGSENYGANRSSNTDGRSGESSGGSGSGGNYGRRRRDSRGRYMGGYQRGNYGYMPMPYYDGSPEELAEELEQMAQNGGSEAKMTALREAARWLRQG